jgi:predicted O-linked N-acetylglucosamine transferase (SPINDLY family)
VCDRHRQRQKNIVALHLSGVIEALRNNSPDALRLLDRALKISPQNADFLADKGNVLGAMGRHHDALLCYQQAISINAGHLSALQNQGATLLLLKRFAEALAVIDRLLQIVPNHAPAFDNRGEALKELGRDEEAIASYRQATVLDPQNVEAWSNLGDALFKLKRHDEAFAAYDKALALKPDLAEAWLGRGNISFDLKRDDDALGAYDKALSHKPDLAAAMNNLRKEAAARGVDAARLIFANSMPQPDHLARHRLADLFLDTLPYNAHTTASDALWMDVPVLTLVGETFAGRVAASLLSAIHLPELITTTPDAYVRMAIELATQPQRLAALKRKLGENRLTTPLFDTQRFTRQIEGAFTAIHRRHQAGLAPDQIVVPP